MFKLRPGSSLGFDFIYFIFSQQVNIRLVKQDM